MQKERRRSRNLPGFERRRVELVHAERIRSRGERYVNPPPRAAPSSLDGTKKSEPPWLDAYRAVRPIHAANVARADALDGAAFPWKEAWRLRQCPSLVLHVCEWHARDSRGRALLLPENAPSESFYPCSSRLCALRSLLDQRQERERARELLARFHPERLYLVTLTLPPTPPDARAIRADLARVRAAFAAVVRGAWGKRHVAGARRWNEGAGQFPERADCRDAVLVHIHAVLVAHEHEEIAADALQAEWARATGGRGSHVHVARSRRPHEAPLFMAYAAKATCVDPGDGCSHTRAWGQLRTRANFVAWAEAISKGSLSASVHLSQTYGVLRGGGKRTAPAPWTRPAASPRGVPLMNLPLALEESCEPDSEDEDEHEPPRRGLPCGVCEEPMRAQAEPLVADETLLTGALVESTPLYLRTLSSALPVPRSALAWLPPPRSFEPKWAYEAQDSCSFEDYLAEIACSWP